VPIAFLAVGLPVGVGVVMAMGDAKPTTTDDTATSAFTALPKGSQARFARHAEPRWESVARLSGSGAATRMVSIAAGAVQWRADWSCRSGSFQMLVAGASEQDMAVQTGTCPDVGVQSSTGAGRGSLQVTASGPWQVRVSQQVDTALTEPPLPGMAAAAPLARGRLHSIQNHGEGTVALYRLPNGRLALRFENLYVSASPGLRIWLSRGRNIDSTLQARQAGHTDAGAIRSTLGSYNQMLPAGTDASEIRTIVIWCPTVLIAFAAAPLTP